MLPEPAKPFADLRADRRRVTLPRLLERRSDREQRDDRERVRGHVDGERQDAGEAEERAACSRPDERDRRVPRLLDGGRVGKLRRRNDRSERSYLRDVEEDEAGALDECDDGDLRERQPLEGQRDDEPADRNDANVIRDEHHCTAVPPIGGDPRERHEKAVWEEPCEGDDARLSQANASTPAREADRRSASQTCRRREELPALQQ